MNGRKEALSRHRVIVGLAALIVITTLGFSVKLFIRGCQEEAILLTSCLACGMMSSIFLIASRLRDEMKKLEVIIECTFVIATYALIGYTLFRIGIIIII